MKVMTSISPQITLFAIGNRSRGDDAAAPQLMDLFLNRDGQHSVNPILHWEECYQLQPEHCYEIETSEMVIFIDSAAVQSHKEGSVQLSAIEGELRFEFSTHILSPTSLLALFEKTFNEPAPSSWLLTIPGYEFELGSPLSRLCESHISQAYAILTEFLEQSAANRLANNHPNLC